VFGSQHVLVGAGVDHEVDPSLVGEFTSRGHPVSDGTVPRMLRQLEFSLQNNAEVALLPAVGARATRPGVMRWVEGRAGRLPRDRASMANVLVVMIESEPVLAGCPAEVVLAAGHGVATIT